MESVEGLGAQTQHAVIWYITLLSLGALSLVLGYILHLIPARFWVVALQAGIVFRFQSLIEGFVTSLGLMTSSLTIMWMIRETSGNHPGIFWSREPRWQKY